MLVRHLPQGQQPLLFLDSLCYGYILDKSMEVNLKYPLWILKLFTTQLVISSKRMKIQLHSWGEKENYSMESL